MAATTTRSVGMRNAVVALMGLLVGCASWEQAGRNSAEVLGDEQDCKAQAYRELSAQIYSSQLRPSRQKSYDGTSESEGAVYKDEDANEEGRQVLITDCMFKKGYRRSSGI